MHDAVSRKTAVEIDGAVDRTTRSNPDDLVGLTRNRDDRGTRCDASGAGVRVVSRVGRSAIATGARGCRENDYRKADEPAEH